MSTTAQPYKLKDKDGNVLHPATSAEIVGITLQNASGVNETKVLSDVVKSMKTDIATHVEDAKVKLAKETTPTTGSYATYTLSQGTTQDDVKVEIPNFAESLTNNTTTYDDTKVSAIIDVAGFVVDSTLV